jgi:carbamoyl-phosphate synthase large subunit
MPAFERNWSVDELYELTGIDRWFLVQLLQIVELQQELSLETASSLEFAQLRRAKRFGFSDARIAELVETDEDSIRALRKKHGLFPVYKTSRYVGAEFESHTPYLYSTYETECEACAHQRA